MQRLSSWRMWLALGLALVAGLAIGAVGVRAAGVRRLALAPRTVLASLDEGEDWDCPVLDGEYTECSAFGGEQGTDEGSAPSGGLRFGCRW